MHLILIILEHFNNSIIMNGTFNFNYVSSRSSQLKLPAGVVLKRPDKQKQGENFKINLYCYSL